MFGREALTTWSLVLLFPDEAVGKAAAGKKSSRNQVAANLSLVLKRNGPKAFGETALQKLFTLRWKRCWLCFGLLGYFYGWLAMARKLGLGEGLFNTVIRGGANAIVSKNAVAHIPYIFLSPWTLKGEAISSVKLLRLNCMSWKKKIELSVQSQKQARLVASFFFLVQFLTFEANDYKSQLKAERWMPNAGLKHQLA